MSWVTNLLGQSGQGTMFLKGMAGGFGETSGIPQLAEKFTRAEGVTGPWAEAGRMLGQMQGVKPQYALPGSTLSKLFELASQPSQRSQQPLKKKTKPKGDIIIPGEEYYFAGE